MNISITSSLCSNALALICPSSSTTVLAQSHTAQKSARAVNLAINEQLVEEVLAFGITD